MTEIKINNNEPAAWVKSNVLKGNHKGYCFLRPSEIGAWVAHLVALRHFDPAKMQQLNEKELRQVDEYCSQINLYPRPNLKVEKTNTKIKSLKF